MADVGLPLYGDRKYNPASKGSSLALCAFELTFDIGNWKKHDLFL